MRFAALISILVSLVVSSQAWAQKDLKITTFNIKWYGLDSKDGPNPTTRDRYLRNFINRNLGDSDVIVFQEIVDVNRFERRVIGNSMNCRTYDSRGSTHQYVVLCHKKNLRFVRDHGDNNYEIEEVDQGSSRMRPALHGIIKDSSGNELFRVIGVHLKAFPDATKRRLDQTEIIARHLKEVDDRIPTVVTGDFNSHVSELTNHHKDDKYLMNDIFRRFRVGVSLEPNNLYTYRSPERAQQLDHFFVSTNVNTSSLFADGPCNDEFDFGPMSNGVEDDLEKYNEYISDHCPVTVRASF